MSDESQEGTFSPLRWICTWKSCIRGSPACFSFLIWDEPRREVTWQFIGVRGKKQILWCAQGQQQAHRSQGRACMAHSEVGASFMDLAGWVSGLDPDILEDTRGKSAISAPERKLWVPGATSVPVKPTPQNPMLEEKIVHWVLRNL